MRVKAALQMKKNQGSNPIDADACMTISQKHGW
jgi:hypothetical protein